MVETGTRRRICHCIYWYAKANNKYMKDYDKNKKSLYLQYWNVNNLYGSVMSQKLSVNKFAWIEDTSQFNENFIKSCTEEAIKDIFLKLMLNIFKNYMTVTMIYHF